MASGTRDRILDALEAILLDRGMSAVTLEAVAAAADVSKGGLLYHFPSKDAMVAAMVRRLGERADDQRAQAQNTGTSLAEWYLEVPDARSADEAALFRSTVAALRSVEGRGVGTETDSTEVQSAVIDVMRLWDRGIQDEVSDPVQAEIIRLVGDGIYFAALLNLPLPDPDLHAQVVARVLGRDRLQ